jgi:hypothetical protein
MLTPIGARWHALCAKRLHGYMQNALHACPGSVGVGAARATAMVLSGMGEFIPEFCPMQPDMQNMQNRRGERGNATLAPGLNAALHAASRERASTVGNRFVQRHAREEKSCFLAR